MMGSRVLDMRKMRMWVALSLLSVLALQMLNHADLVVPGEFLDGIGSYAIVSIFFYGLMRVLRVSTLEYFVKPQGGFISVIAVIFMAFLIFTQLRGEPFHWIGAWDLVRGVVFLFFVGLGEEILSRGFVFGVLQRYGFYLGVIGSSVMFGLMHINVYLDNWDPWQAYWHVVSAATFGVFAVVLMIVTRSIWMPIAFHTVSNAGLLFQSLPTPEEEAYRVSIDFWSGLGQPLPNGAVFVVPAIFLLWLHHGARIPSIFRGRQMPASFSKLAVRLGLIEVS